MIMMDDDAAVSVPSTSSQRQMQKNPYARGSIIRVAMKNFLTYDEFQLKLDPKLNVIIGPNGTGKSSIVCAICLGLGGKTGFLARAKDVGEYVKYGQTKAVVEIEISDEPENVYICRQIIKHATKSTSTWFLNDELVSSKDIDDTVRGLNIQLSNLCQFLPQEKVADFAKMNKIELLENTELAVCEPQMHQDHMTLKEFRGNEKELEVTFNSEVENLDMMKRKNQRMEQDVMRFQERQKLLKKVDQLETKRAWTLYEDARIAFVNLKAEWERLRKEYNNTKRETATLEKGLDQATGHAERINQQMREKSERLKNVVNMTRKIHDKISSVKEDIKCKEMEFQENEKYEQQRMKKMEEYQVMVESWRKDLSELEVLDVQPQIDGLSAELNVVMGKISNIEFDSQSIQSENETRAREIKASPKMFTVARYLNRVEGMKVHLALISGHRLKAPLTYVFIVAIDCDRKIAHLNNLSNRRLQQLKQFNKDVYSAVEWLRQNKAMFKGNVYEPIILQLNTTDNQCAEVLENHIAFRDLAAFVCEEPEDNILLVSELRGKRGLKVNVVKAPRNSNGKLKQPSEYLPRKPIEQLSKWGFTKYMREMFTAPNPVMSYLCKQYAVHQVPIGSKNTLDILDQVNEHSKQTLFYIPSFQKPQSKEFSPGLRFSVKRSLNQPQYLTSNVDPEQIMEVENKRKHLQFLNQKDAARVKQFQKEKVELEKKDNELRTKKKELQSVNSRKRTLEYNIQAKLDLIYDLRNKAVDIEELRQELRVSFSKIYLGKKDLALKFSENVKECTSLTLDKARMTVQYVAAIAKKNRIDKKIRDGQAAVIDSKRNLEKAEDDKREAQVIARQYLAEAKKRTGGEGANNIAGLSKDLLEIFSTLPNTITELETLIHDYKARVECSTSTDPQVVEEYNRRKREIAALQRKVDQLSEQLQTSRNEIGEVKERWLKRINELVERINDKFSTYFAQMGCAGEVDLYRENTEEFDKYGIRIRVKFRKTSSLQELNPYRQSGGERSVSTMLYLMSLQSLRVCPFRLVDEINQGMDPYNERRVFDIIVRSYCDPESSQYFLITPKLLPNLTYNEHMTVHCIYNGPFMLPLNQWKIKRFKRYRRRLQYDDQ